jgi:hypothetical protein
MRGEGSSCAQRLADASAARRAFSIWDLIAGVMFAALTGWTVAAALLKQDGAGDATAPRTSSTLILYVLGSCSCRHLDHRHVLAARRGQRHGRGGDSVRALDVILSRSSRQERPVGFWVLDLVGVLSAAVSLSLGRSHRRARALAG